MPLASPAGIPNLARLIRQYRGMGLALLGAFVMTGCAPTAPFQSSTAANSVKVEISGERMLGNWTLYTFDDGDTCSRRKVVAGSATFRNLDVRVDGGRRHSYMMFQTYGTQYCRIAISFDAVAGNIYSVRVSSDGQRCYMATLNTTVSVAGVREPTTVRRTFQTPFVESGSWCGAIDRSQIGLPIESSSTRTNPEPQPAAPDRTRSGTTLDDLKDLLPKK